ncbi:hypothetical protein JXA63_03945 [Candidatus Woesebacteria bacterium]|nr:hypothetical protein [Candidatus Woesebacteria bacterium]
MSERQNQQQECNVLSEKDILKILDVQKNLLLTTGTYGMGKENVFKLADKLAGSPEEHTELTGRKWGQQS